jgi:hypothetical protein
MCKNGCKRPLVKQTGYCIFCLAYWKFHKTMAYKKFTDQFKKVRSGCWEWTGAKQDAYGLFKPKDGLVCRAHRASYEHYVGPIPFGYHIDHLCRNTMCVNPEHLEAVTAQENYRRIGKPPMVILNT